MQDTPYIQSELIRLSAPTLSDLETLYASWQEREVIWAYNFRLGDTFPQYMERWRANPWDAAIYRRPDGCLLGRVGLSPGFPDLTITILSPYRGAGYGTMAFALAAQYCFETLRIKRLYAGAYEDNLPSLAMIKKCGFVRHPKGDGIEPHIITGQPRLQLDFVLENPDCGGPMVTT